MLSAIWIAVVKIELALYRRVPVTSRILLASVIIWYAVLIHGLLHFAPAITVWLVTAGTWTSLAVPAAFLVERSTGWSRFAPHHWPKDYQPTIKG